MGEVLVDGGLPALVREVVRRDQLEVANSRFSATQTVSNMFIGPPLGALLFGLDQALAFAAAAALYVAATAMLTRVAGSFKATVDRERARRTATLRSPSRSR